MGTQAEEEAAWGRTRKELASRSREECFEMTRELFQENQDLKALQEQILSAEAGPTDDSVSEEFAQWQDDVRQSVLEAMIGFRRVLDSTEDLRYAVSEEMQTGNTRGNPSPADLMELCSAARDLVSFHLA